MRSWATWVVLSIVAAGQGCSSTPRCAAHETLCSDSRTGQLRPVCVDLRWDELHCGACEQSCGSGGDWCSEGQCRRNPCTLNGCPEPACADTDTNPLHCGACGNRCPLPTSCIQGRCQPTELALCLLEPELVDVGADVPRVTALPGAVSSATAWQGELLLHDEVGGQLWRATRDGLDWSFRDGGLHQPGRVLFSRGPDRWAVNTGTGLAWRVTAASFEYGPLAEETVDVGPGATAVAAGLDWLWVTRTGPDAGATEVLGYALEAEQPPRQVVRRPVLLPARDSGVPSLVGIDWDQELGSVGDLLLAFRGSDSLARVGRDGGVALVPIPDRCPELRGLAQVDAMWLVLACRDRVLGFNAESKRFVRWDVPAGFSASTLAITSAQVVLVADAESGRRWRLREGFGQLAELSPALTACDGGIATILTLP